MALLATLTCIGCAQATPDSTSGTKQGEGIRVRLANSQSLGEVGDYIAFLESYEAQASTAFADPYARLNGCPHPTWSIERDLLEMAYDNTADGENFYAKLKEYAEGFLPPSNHDTEEIEAMAEELAMNASLAGIYLAIREDEIIGVARRIKKRWGPDEVSWLSDPFACVEEVGENCGASGRNDETVSIGEITNSTDKRWVDAYLIAGLCALGGQGAGTRLLETMASKRLPDDQRRSGLDAFLWWYSLPGAVGFYERCSPLCKSSKQYRVPAYRKAGWWRRLLGQSVVTEKIESPVFVLPQNRTKDFTCTKSTSG